MQHTKTFWYNLFANEYYDKNDIEKVKMKEKITINTDIDQKDYKKTRGGTRANWYVD